MYMIYTTPAFFAKRTFNARPSTTILDEHICVCFKRRRKSRRTVREARWGKSLGRSGLNGKGKSLNDDGRQLAGSLIVITARGLKSG